MTRIRFSVLMCAVMLTTAMIASGAVFVSVAVGPPVLPVYSQPLCPGPGYLWTPGYWAWSPDGYYWVPGTWALPPDPGLLWTPGYWGFSAGLYNWYPGYWGPVVGFYGGINYGFGYPGNGYYGGYWQGRHFYYNRAVNNVNINNVHYAYNRAVVNHANVSRVSFNGGRGGIQARPTSAQFAAEHEHHMAATSQQVAHEQAARNDRAQLASVNHGRPAVVATPRPGAFNAHEKAQASQPMNRHEPAPNVAKNNRPVTHPAQENHQQARVQENVPHPQQNSHPQEQAQRNAPRAPQQQAHNVPQHSPAEHAAPARTPQPQYHATARPPERMMPQQAPHRAEPPRQMASHQAPSRGHEQGHPR